jgi:hypothetical protein
VWVTLGGHTLTGRETTVLRIGPSASLIDALDGDLVGALASTPVGTRVKAGDEVFSLCWEGVLMSDADELYHSRFEASSGVCAVRAPVDGRVLAYNDLQTVGADSQSDRARWLVQIEPDDPSSLLSLLETEVPAEMAA